MVDYRLYAITWKNIIDYNWLRLQIMITLCLGYTVFDFCRVSKRNFARRNKTALWHRGQAATATSFKREFYIIIFLNKLKIVKITKSKLWKNQNKTSMAKAMGPFRDLQPAPS